MEYPNHKDVDDEVKLETTASTLLETRKTLLMRFQKLHVRRKKLAQLPQEEWHIELPCEVQCLWLGSKPRIGYEINSLIPDAMMVLKQVEGASKCYERIGIGSGMFASLFEHCDQQDITLV